MDRSTSLVLSRINRRFYDRWAGEFDARRSAPWPGWSRLIELWQEHGRPPAPRVLDVGCGNGRFGLRLARDLGPGWSYVGLDASQPLLAVADGRLAAAGLGAAAALVRWDLVAAALPGRRFELPVGGRFDLAVAFGLLHHVPGLELRCRLLAALGRRLSPGGLLAVSLWRFGERPRFDRRTVPWDGAAWDEAARDEAAWCEAGDQLRVDPARLEAGDRLLRWGAGPGLRYCHAVTAADEAALVAAPAREAPLELVHSFDADGAQGDLNRYLVWRRT